MKTSFLLPIAVASALVVSARAEDKETAVKLDGIPAPAAEAIKKHAKDARIEKVSKETDHGKVEYEATLHTKGGVREISVDASGKLLADELTIDINAVPKKARAAIEQRAAGGKIVKLEKVLEDGKTTYEALLQNKSGREEVIFSPSGEVVKVEKKGARED